MTLNKIRAKILLQNIFIVKLQINIVPRTKILQIHSEKKKGKTCYEKRSF